MSEKKTELIQFRVSELEKSVITSKAKLLNMTVTDYIKYCCLFCNASQEFMQKMFGEKSNLNRF